MNSKKLTALATALLMTFSLAACGGSDSPDSVVATVNGVEITQHQFDAYNEINMQLYGYDPSTITDDQKDGFLDNMVDIECIKQYYDQQGTDIYGDDYETNLESFIDSAKEQQADFITQYGITDEDLKLYYEDYYASSALFQEVELENSEDDISDLAKTYYDEHKEEYLQEDGTYTAFEDVLQSVYYSVYSQLYQEKTDEIREGMEVDIK